MQAVCNSRRWHWALLLAATSLTACGGDHSLTGPPGGDGDGNDNVAHPFVHPTGSQFTLPSYISVKGDMRGPIYVGAAAGPCTGLEPVSASLDFVAVCMTLHNSGATDTTLVLPAGLVMIAEDTATQNGTQVVPISVRIGAGRDTTILYSLYCTNEHRNPSTDTDVFHFGPVSNNAELAEIIDLVKDKDVTTSDARDAIQFAIWEVSDEGGLTDETRAELAGLE
ncbi:MAG TPA: hypothetical protein VFL88_01695 [Gemmatimonadales bacterium]|nr:hypothetical protein [Gemmatimonadales bacterium]